MKTTLYALAFLVAASATSASASDVTYAARHGVSEANAMYQETYRQEGMAGLENAVDNCYRKQAQRPSVETLAACASLDRRAMYEDRAFSAQMGTPVVPYFANERPMNRMRRALYAMNLSERQALELLDVVGSN